MSKRFVAGLVLLMTGSFAAGAAATSATTWTPFASASDSGTYGAYTSANADVIKPHILAVRSSAKADLSWYLNCSGEVKDAKAQAVVVTDVSTAAKCSLNGAAVLSGGGKITVQLLRGR